MPSCISWSRFPWITPKILQNRLKAKISESAVSDLVFCNVKGGKKKVAKPRRGGRTPLQVAPPSSTVQRASEVSCSERNVVDA